MFNFAIAKPSSKVNGVVGDIELISSDNSITINPNTNTKTIDIKAIGGGGSPSYLHTQAVPSALWTVNHNLGFKPDVATYTSGGLEFVAEVLHISDNQFTVTLALPTAGFARCT